MKLSVPARRMILALASGSSALVTGCATYRPIDRNAAGALPEVRVELNERGTLELAPRIGPNAASLTGKMRNVSDTSLVVALTQVVTRNGSDQQWSGEEISVPVSWVRGYAQRTASARKTTLFVGGILAAVAAIGAAFQAGNSGSGGGNQNGGTPR